MLLPIADWQRILEDLEELDELREYDDAKQRPSDSVAFDQALAEIRQGNIL